MARKPHTPIEPEVVSGEIPAGHALMLADEAELKDMENEQAFNAARIIGRIETALFSETVSQKVIVESFIELKQNRAYRAIHYRDIDGNLKRISDLDEFCERYLKKTYRRVKQMVDNYHLIGSDLFETAEQIGFRQKDYGALKALPASDQDVIKQAMSPETDRDQILDLMQELAARHASEKASLQAIAEDARATAEARGEVIAKKETRINSLETDLAKSRRRLESATPDQVGADLCQETAGIGWGIVGQINVGLARAFGALHEHARANDCTHEEFMSGVLFEIERALGAIREDYAVKARPDGDARPDWTRPDFDWQAAEQTEEMKAAMARFEQEHGYNPLNRAA